MIVELQEDKNGDLILQLPDEILNQVGWDEGDALLWEMLDDGRVSITKRSDEHENS